jgi:hypothetical protein
MEQLPQKKTPSLQPRGPIERAAKALIDQNICLVEYGKQIQRRLGNPLVLLVSSKNIFLVFSTLVVRDY